MFILPNVKHSFTNKPISDPSRKFLQGFGAEHEREPEQPVLCSMVN